MSRKMLLAIGICATIAGCDYFIPERSTAAPPASSEIAEQMPTPAPQPLVTTIDLTKLAAAPKVAISYTNGLPTILGGDSTLATAGFTEGAFFTIAPQDEAKFSEKVVNVIVKARTSGADIATFGVAYSTAEVGNSGWHIFEVGSDPRDYQFEFEVPAKINGNGDYIGFFATPAVTIESVRLETES